MAEYAAAAITALTTSAAIVSSSTAHRRQIYNRGCNGIENPPWQRRPPFTSMSLRRASAYYGQPSLCYPPGLHEHHVHHAECPASQCHYRAFLMDSIQRYNEARRALRDTYVWNLRELAYVHAAQRHKPASEKAAEADRLYEYYVSRVRDVFEEHRCDHRRLFGQDYLYWAQPEREDYVRLLLRDRPKSRIASRIENSSSDTSGNSEKRGTDSTNTKDMQGEREERLECAGVKSGDEKSSVRGTGDRVR
ncbi:hypothetical protein F5Y00DRAFT_256634 [Daldinia vernicosa]|uniref:uncharacterized protein n=1 Tax=Daldinia vernicosa TaxID=114800 RepID=UPI002008285B|nr:uncharacterized protein F5Y00DRAFT_256634 [Daldinia vernicosa]KAI0854136.1 hypothetical protein F5Y00DRAFT_256634 [Daldinia vernicosa]